MKAYPIEFRQKVLEYIEKGGKKVDAIKLFNIGESTLYQWLRRAKRGELAPKPGGQKKPYKIDSERLREYVAEHPDAFLHEIAEVFGVSHGGIFDALKRLGISRKKKHTPTAKPIRSCKPNSAKKSAARRQMSSFS